MDSFDEFIFQDMNILNDRNACRKFKEYKQRKNPFDIYPDKDFIDLYRFNKKTARFIINLIKDDIVTNSTSIGTPISADIMVMATIRYIAKGSYQKDIGDVHGISQQSMSLIIKKVVAALSRKMTNFIKFPLEPSNLQKLKEGFYNIARFPQCIGVIDCTHIKIKNPGGEIGGRHRCRKGFYSINVQVICDSNYKILDIVARWRGSAHDSRIWRESIIKERLENANLGGGIILGDNGYACSKILLTPFRHTENLSREKQKYNTAHVLTRNVVEKLFGQLKNKFRCCFNGIHVDLNTAKNMIIAIAVLHNIAKDTGSEFYNDHYNDQNTSVSNEEVNDNEEQFTENNTGSAFRNQFVTRYFT